MPAPSRCTGGRLVQRGQSHSRRRESRTTPPANAPQELHLTGLGVARSITTGIIAFANAFELQLQSPPAPQVADVGGRDEHIAAADLKAVGLRTYWAPDTPGTAESAWLLFGMSTYAPWSTPNAVVFEVWIDVDNDGRSDYRLFNTDEARFANNAAHGDSFVAALENLNAGSKHIEAPLNALPGEAVEIAPYLSSVMLLPVRAADLGLDATHTQFHYYVRTISIDRTEETDKTVEQTLVLAYDMAYPGLVFTHPLPGSGENWPSQFPDQAGATIVVQPAPNGYFGRIARGILLFHFQNRAAQQAEIVKIDYQWPYNLHLPTIAR